MASANARDSKGSFSLVTMEPRDVRRRVRRAFHVKRWSRHTKIAVGAWIPTVVVALALVTGPNGPAASDTAAPTPTSAPTRFKMTGTFPTKLPETVPVDVALGAWLRGIRAKGLPTYARMARHNKAGRLLTRRPGGSLARRRH
jgi:hypothetical protein